MDNGTMRDYIADLVEQANALEVQFRSLTAVIEQLQKERDRYRDLWLEAEAKLTHPARANG
jgi:hypothetical protein